MKTLFIFLFIPLLGNAQTSFSRLYGGNDYDFGLAVQQTTDGGYMLFGQTSSFGAGYQDMYLIKTDDVGDVEWERTYGGTDWEHGISAQQTDDDGYILCGSYSGLGTDTLTLIRTDAQGNELWNKRYSGSVDRDVGQSVQQTADGGFIAVGFTSASPEENIFMVKTDGGGNLQWSKTHQFAGKQITRSVRQTSDGGYILAGSTSGLGASDQDLFLVRTNSIGDTLWTKRYGSESFEDGGRVEITSDGGFMLIGYEYFDGSVLLTKTDGLGNEQWAQSYGGPGLDIGYDVKQTNDGGYVVGGRYHDTISDSHHMYAFKTNSQGTLEWEYVYPERYRSDAYSVNLTSDGGFILLGSATDSTMGNFESDMYLLKVNDQGLASIAETAVNGVSMIAFPNPTTSTITLQTETPLSQAWLTDLTGRRLMQLQPNGGQWQVDLSALPHGMYLVEVFTEKGKRGVRKVVRE